MGQCIFFRTFSENTKYSYSVIEFPKRLIYIHLTQFTALTQAVLFMNAIGSICILYIDNAIARLIHFKIIPY